MGIDRAFNKICERWGQCLTNIRDEDSKALVIGISVGLGQLFNDSVAAELHWLQQSRQEFGGLTAWGMLATGDRLNILSVADQLDEERGLR